MIWMQLAGALAVESGIVADPLNAQNWIDLLRGTKAYKRYLKSEDHEKELKERQCLKAWQAGHLLKFLANLEKVTGKELPLHVKRMFSCEPNPELEVLRVDMAPHEDLRKVAAFIKEDSRADGLRAGLDKDWSNRHRMKMHNEMRPLKQQTKLPEPGAVALGCQPDSYRTAGLSRN